MHHPGPPRFAAVGDEIELAPRGPDPDRAAAYGWTLVDAPTAATATVGDGAVVAFEPDAAGLYRLRHDTPGESHTLTVRVFGADRQPGETGTRQQYSGTEPPPATDHTVPETDAPAAARDDPGSGLARLDDEADPERPRIDLSTHTDEAAGDLVVTATVDGAPDATVEFLVDDRDDLPAAAATTGDGQFRVDAGAVGDRLRIHAVAVADSYSVPAQVDVTRASDGDSGATGDDVAGGDAAGDDATDGADRVDATDAGETHAVAGESFTVTNPYAPPAWALDAVVYEVYVRTFAGDDPAAADDGPDTVFDRIRDRLDYLTDLGVDVLWLTPVVENDHAPHGYNITDFFEIAADLGGREAYERLIDAAHDRGLRVVFDLVLNHSARAHPFFVDAYGEGGNVAVGEGSPNPDSDYYEWYDWREDGEPETYFEWEHIANFDFDSLAVRRHLLDAVDEWARLVDGFRCDMAWAVPNAFWQEIHDRLKARDADFWLLDETIPYIPEFQAGLFDTHFDSTTAFQLREVGAGEAPADSLLDAVAERRRIGFPSYASFMVYAENHDETRYVQKCGREAALAAAGAVATLPGTPMVYAGQEIGQLGRRDALAWDDADETLQTHYRRLLSLRGEESALAAREPLARVEHTVTDGEPERVVAYARGGDDGVVVVLNFGGEPATVDVAPAVGDVNLLDGESVDPTVPTVENVLVVERR